MGENNKIVMMTDSGCYSLSRECSGGDRRTLNERNDQTQSEGKNQVCAGYVDLLERSSEHQESSESETFNHTVDHNAYKSFYVNDIPYNTNDTEETIKEYFKKLSPYKGKQDFLYSMFDIP